MLAAFFVLLAVAVSFNGMFSFAYQVQLPGAFTDCRTTAKYDVTGCSFTEKDWVETPSESSSFWVQVTDVESFNDGVKPVVPYLWYNGYRVHSSQALNNVYIEDVDTSRSMRNSLENASRCTGTFDLAPSDGGFVETTETSQDYQEDSDDLDSGDLHTSKFMQPTSVVASEVRVTDRGEVFCRFSTWKVLEKGVDLPGDLVSYNGDDLDWESASIFVDLEADSDGDGVIDAEDQFPSDSNCVRDKDGDGVCDQSDAFPEDVEFSSDRDGDRFPDTNDLCPSTAGQSRWDGCNNVLTFIVEKFVPESLVAMF